MESWLNSAKKDKEEEKIITAVMNKLQSTTGLNKNLIRDFGERWEHIQKKSVNMTKKGWKKSV